MTSEEEKKSPKLTKVTVEELNEVTKVIEEVLNRADKTDIENDILMHMIAWQEIKIERMYKLFLALVAIYAVLIVAYFYKI